MDELKIALESKHEHETLQLQEFHAQEIEELQGRIETAVLAKRETETLKVLKDQALVANSHLRTSQLDYLDQVERLRNY